MHNSDWERRATSISQDCDYSIIRLAPDSKMSQCDIVGQQGCDMRELVHDDAMARSDIQKDLASDPNPQNWLLALSIMVNDRTSDPGAKDPTLNDAFYWFFDPLEMLKSTSDKETLFPCYLVQQASTNEMSKDDIKKHWRELLKGSYKTLTNLWGEEQVPIGISMFLDERMYKHVRVLTYKEFTNVEGDEDVHTLQNFTQFCRDYWPTKKDSRVPLYKYILDDPEFGFTEIYKCLNFFGEPANDWQCPLKRNNALHTIHNGQILEVDPKKYFKF